MEQARRGRVISGVAALLALAGLPAVAQEPQAPAPAEPTLLPPPRVVSAYPGPSYYVYPASSYEATRCKCCWQDKMLGYPEEFIPTPLGEFLYRHGSTMVANGIAARMVLYDYDFIDGTAQLNLRGRDQLAKIACWLPHNFCSIIVERTPGTPGLDEGRRLAVLNELARGTFPVPAQRVVVGRRISNGLSGTEALLIDANLRALTEARGRSGLGSGTGTSAASTGGTTGTGAATGGSR